MARCAYDGCCSPYEKKDHAGAPRAGIKKRDVLG